MIIEVKNFKKIDNIFIYLENLFLNNENYIFRGHKDKTWRLKTSLHRYMSFFHSLDIDEIIKKFRANITKIGIKPFDNGCNNRLNWLEYARHYGVPTPCLDFTYSPYIALFFALNGAKVDITKKNNDYVYIYALNTMSLAHDWSYNINTNPEPMTHEQIFSNFLYSNSFNWKKGYPKDELFIIPYSSSYTRRMHRQQGLLLYDSINYDSFGCKDLEEYIEQIQEPEGSEATLLKIRIPKKYVTQIFEKLDMMGITGSNLFDDQIGAQMDIMNSYYFNSNTFHLRDIQFDN